MTHRRITYTWHGDVRYAPAARPGSTKLLVAGSYKRPHTGHWPGPLLNEFLDHVLDPVFLSVSLVYFFGARPPREAN